MELEPVSSELVPIEDQGTVDRIIDAASRIDIDRFQQLSRKDDISQLSSNTILEGLEILSDGIFEVAPGRFEASATVYLTLEYGGSRDSVSIPDSYPAVVRGTFDKGTVEITEIEVDTGSFYE
jgi:hypothetical protein